MSPTMRASTSEQTARVFPHSPLSLEHALEITPVTVRVCKTVLVGHERASARGKDENR